MFPLRRHAAALRVSRGLHLQTRGVAKHHRRHGGICEQALAELIVLRAHDEPLGVASVDRGDDAVERGRGRVRAVLDLLQFASVERRLLQILSHQPELLLDASRGEELRGRAEVLDDHILRVAELHRHHRVDEVAVHEHLDRGNGGSDA